MPQALGLRREDYNSNSAMLVGDENMIVSMNERPQETIIRIDKGPLR